MEHADVVQSLKDLSQLHAAGVLSDEEFAQAKRQVIEGSGPAPSASWGRGPSAPETAEAPTVVRPRYGFTQNVAGNAAGNAASRRPDQQTPPAVSLMKSAPPSTPPADTVQIPAQRADVVPQNGPWGSSAGFRQPAPMPVPAPPAPRPQHAGAIIAALAAVLAGVSFLVLPMISVGPFGASGSRLASLGSLPGARGFYALWLIPVAAVVVLVLAVRQLMQPPLSGSGRKVTLIPLILLAAVTALAYLAMLVLVQEQLTSAGASSFGISVLDLAGTGFWVALVSTVAAAVAGGVELGVNRGTPDGLPRSPNAPPRPVPATRNIAFVATAVVIVLAMVGAAIWNVTSSPTSSSQNLAALENQGSSSAGTQDPGSTVGSGDSSGSSSTGQSSSPVQDAATFVESYYNLLPGNPDQAWEMLSPDMQAVSGDQQGFDDFWAGISAVSLENVQTTGQSTVEATVDFTRNDGSWTRENYSFSVSDSAGQQVIESSSLLNVVASGDSSSGGSSGGSSSDGPSTMGIVDVSAVSSNPDAGVIGETLDEYFSGINQRDWALALSSLDPRVIDQSDPNAVARFEQGESTTTDSNIVVQSIQADSASPTGSSATVTFQSNQDPSLGPDGESCTLWKLDYQFSYAAGVSLYIYQSKGTHTPC